MQTSNHAKDDEFKPDSPPWGVLAPETELNSGFNHLMDLLGLVESGIEAAFSLSMALFILSKRAPRGSVLSQHQRDQLLQAIIRADAVARNALPAIDPREIDWGLTAAYLQACYWGMQPAERDARHRGERLDVRRHARILRNSANNVAMREILKRYEHVTLPDKDLLVASYRAHISRNSARNAALHKRLKPQERALERVHAVRTFAREAGNVPPGSQGN